MKKISVLALSIIMICSTKAEVVKFSNPREIIPLAKRYLPEDAVILEAGAFDGSDTIYLADEFPSAQIHSFEPIPSLYETVCIKSAHNSRIHVYDVALSNTCEPKSFYISTNWYNPEVPSASSSLLKPKEHLNYDPGVLFNHVIDVDCVTIDSWARTHTINRIDFMWLDLQGSELDVLKGSPEILKNVTAILTEIEFVEAYEGQGLYEDIKAYLESQGFTLVAFSNAHKWYGDALFVRTSKL